MQIIRYRINMEKKDDQYYLLPLGDIHWNNPGCDVEMFRRKRNLIRDNPYYITVLIGDNTENNNSENERSLATFDPEMLALMGKKGLPSQQIREIREELKPIIHKAIGMHPGNHDDRTMNHDSFKLNYIEWFKLAAGVDVNYLGDRAYIILEFYHKKKLVYEYKLITMHGTSFNGKTPSTVENAVYNAYNGYEDFDAIIFGHTHFTFANKHYRKYLDTTTAELKTKKYYIVNTGTFLNGEMVDIDAYGDKKFSGAIREPGTATLTFNPYQAELFAHV